MSSDDFSQGATAAAPHSVETTVISELVVTSTLLLPGNTEPETLSDGMFTLTVCIASFQSYPPSLFL